MTKKKMFVLLAAAAAAAVFAIIVLWQLSSGVGPEESVVEVPATRGDIVVSISTTGVVEPQNRLEIKPTVAGRIEKIMVVEGDRVSAGQELALLSSTDRATLLDAARKQGAEALAYWEEVYKASPLIAPIAGEVIVRAAEPGQTVAASDPVLVLSDRLIVTAQVDETDIGGVKVGQPAFVSLDAYPETRIRSVVDHIAYESEVVNNVTIYQVDILPESIPDIFRSGMSANVEILKEEKRNVLTLPETAVRRGRGSSSVLVRRSAGAAPESREVETGVSDGENVEIISGLEEGETALIVPRKQASAERPASGTNPFLPARGRRH
ncbi:MAG: efflux RND transporter periplasmic adaptor subunit [PVC group bacterium]